MNTTGHTEANQRSSYSCNTSLAVATSECEEQEQEGDLFLVLLVSGKLSSLCLYRVPADSACNASSLGAR